MTHQIMEWKDHCQLVKIIKAIGQMKDELGGKIMTEFARLRLKTYPYFIDDGSGHKKAKGTKKRVIKRSLKFEDCKKCLQNN